MYLSALHVVAKKLLATLQSKLKTEALQQFDEARIGADTVEDGKVIEAYQEVRAFGVRTL